MLIVKNYSEVAEIYLSGDIVDDEAGGVISQFDMTGYEFPQKLREQLDAIGDKPIDIHINSAGGSIPAGCAMANLIKRHRARTVAYVDGYCGSIATQIFFSADTCRMPRNTYLCLHKPFTVTTGNADELRKTADFLDTLQEGLETTYMSKLRNDMTCQDLRDMVNAETWLTGDEAAQKFEIELLESVKVLNCIGDVAKLKSLQFKRIPAALNFSAEVSPLITDKIKIALSRAEGLMIR